MTINEMIMLAIAAYFIMFSLIVNTTNISSSLVFKVIPMFSAIALGLMAFKIIQIGANMPFIQNCAATDISSGMFYKDPGANSMLISIADPGGWRPTAKHTFAEQYNFEFLDIEKTDTMFDDECRVSMVQAGDLVTLLRSALARDMNVIVHCTMGVCRSGAVTEIGVQMGFTDTKRYRQPNLLVKHSMMSILGWAYDDNEAEQPIDLSAKFDWEGDI